MVNGLILTKFDEQRNFIEDIFNKHLNKSVNAIPSLFELNQFNKPVKDLSKVKNISTIQIKNNDIIYSLCLLKDKRLVSGSRNGTITVYNRSYQPQFHIKNANGSIVSLCVLRDGELVSGGFKEIKVWRINEDDYHLIRTLRAHTQSVTKVIELKDGKICSCSDDKRIKIWDNYQCIKTLDENSYEIKSVMEFNNFIIYASSPLFVESDEDGELRILNGSKYECIKIIKHIKCWSNNSLSKLNETTVIVGGDNIIYFVDFKAFQIKRLVDYSLKNICCLYVNGSGLVFLGNSKGKIFCYEYASDKIVSKDKFHDDWIFCILETEDNKLISSSNDETIKIYN